MKTSREIMVEFFEGLGKCNDDQLRVALNVIWTMELLLINQKEYNPYTGQPKAVQLILCKIAHPTHPTVIKVVNHVVHYLHVYYRDQVEIGDEWIFGEEVWHLRELENWRCYEIIPNAGTVMDHFYQPVQAFKDHFKLPLREALVAIARSYTDETYE